MERHVYPGGQRRPDHSPSRSSRLSMVQANVRSLLRGSSVYSGTAHPTNYNTPILPTPNFLRKNSGQIGNLVENAHPQTPRDFRFPPLVSSPFTPEVIPSPTSNHSRQSITPAEPERPYFPGRAQAAAGIDIASVQLAHPLQTAPRKKRKRQHRRAWVRKPRDRTLRFPSSRSGHVKFKSICCLLSGLLLATILSIYLSFALSQRVLGLGVHVLFIFAILATTIFFCHSLVRLCMLAVRPAARSHRSHRSRNDHTPGTTVQAESFAPERPIRVHMARDEEIAIGGEGVFEEGQSDRAEMMEKESRVGPKPPPPAYGLWRSSVRVDPNLLHWQRVEEVSSALPNTSASATSLHKRVAAPGTDDEARTAQPRPPSYASDDGVEYVVAAAPRSTVAAPLRPPSDVHPAYRT